MTANPLDPTYRPKNFDECQATLAAYFDSVADQRAVWRQRNSTYHAEIRRALRFYIPPGLRVLDLGCGTGDVLACVEPSRGVGVDFSGKMIDLAKARHAANANLTFVHAAAETYAPTATATASAGSADSADGSNPDATFDAIILSDLLPYTYDIRGLFKNIRRWCHRRTRLVMHFHSRLWEPALGLATAMGLKTRQPVLNWVTREDVINLLRLAEFEPVKIEPRVMMPVWLPLLTGFCNRFLAKMPLWRHLCLTNWVVARPTGAAMRLDPASTSVSIVVPCRNEAGNIAPLIERLPKFAPNIEVIFVEGHSKDDTKAAVERAIAANPGQNLSLYVQSGKGKADAVRLGFSKAKNDVLMILDADLSVAPEDLPPFYEALVAGQGEFINGSRLVYPMEGEAMRLLNLLGNKFFATTFSFLLGQRLKDTLCGTKVLLRTDYERLAAGRGFFGEFDPFGDYDLLFGAAKLNLKIIEVPIRYRARVYGSTNIRRFRDGWLLLKLCAVGFRKLKMS